MLDGLPRPRIAGVRRFEQGQHVLRAAGRPQREPMVIAIGEDAAAPDRHQARVADRRQDHGWCSSLSVIHSL